MARETTFYHLVVVLATYSKLHPINKRPSPSKSLCRAITACVYIDQSSFSRYFANADPRYPFYEGNWTSGGDSGLYNRLGRGYPDVAAVADNIVLWYEARYGHTGGTSASEKPPKQ